MWADDTLRVFGRQDKLSGNDQCPFLGLADSEKWIRIGEGRVPANVTADQRLAQGGHVAARVGHFTEYLVTAPPAWISEFGPAAA